MSDSSSDLVNGQKGKKQRKWLLWGKTGLIAGTIGGAIFFVLIFLPLFSTGSVFPGMDSTMFSSGAVYVILCIGSLAHLGVSFLTGVIGGFLFSRMRPKWGNSGAVIGGLIIVIILVAVTAYDKGPYLFLPEFEEVGFTGSSLPGYDWEKWIVVGRDFTEEDALKVGNFLQRGIEGPVDIGFYCLEDYERAPFSEEYMLYEYTKADKDSPPSVSTPANPSRPNQGAACK